MDYILLHEISKIDKDIADIKWDKTLEQLEKRITTQRTNFEKAKEEYKGLSNELKETQLEITELNAKCDGINREIRNCDEMLYSTTSLKTIETCQNKIEELKKQIQNEDEKIYQKMLKLEEIQGGLNKISNSGVKIKKEYDKLKLEYHNNFSEKRKIVKDLITRREIILKKLPENIINEYEEIRKKRFYGMSEIIEDICSGCGISLPIVAISEAKKHKELVKCPNCERFLYIE